MIQTHCGMRYEICRKKSFHVVVGSGMKILLPHWISSFISTRCWQLWSTAMMMTTTIKLATVDQGGTIW